MSYKRTEISKEQVARQLAVCEEIKRELAAGSRAMVDTYGCQQNEEDSEKLRGYLAAMGYEMTDNEHEADVIVINTCAVREHAEQRVFGNLGALTHTKKENPNQMIAVCGCMVKQEHIVEKIKSPIRWSVLFSDRTSFGAFRSCCKGQGRAKSAFTRPARVTAAWRRACRICATAR